MFNKHFFMFLFLNVNVSLILLLCSKLPFLDKIGEKCTLLRGLLGTELKKQVEFCFLSLLISGFPSNIEPRQLRATEFFLS